MTTQPSRRGRGRPPHPDILTPREWQVLDLLRDGLTNEQIAQRLDVSIAGAKYHVSEILTKLGVQTREEAAAWQPEAVPVRWWQRATTWVPRRAWPLIGAAAVATVAGLGVLAYVALQTGSEETQGQAAARATTSPTVSGTPVPILIPVPSPRPKSEPEAVNIPLGQVLQPVEQGIPITDAGRYLLDIQSGTLWRFGMAGELSPDGSRFAATQCCAPAGGLDIIDLATGTGTRIVERDVQQAAWFPDSNRLLFYFSVPEPGIYETYSINADGTNLEKLFDGGFQRQAWSPSGNYLAFVGPQNQTTVRQVETGTQSTLVDDFVNFDWSPVTDRLAYATHDGLFIYDAPGGDSNRLATGPTSGPVRWSPDGLKILAPYGDAVPVGNGATQFSVQAPHVFDLTGQSSPVELPPGVGHSWSPDSSRIAYEEFGCLTGAWDIYTVLPDGTGSARLTATPADIKEGPLWSPHGSTLAFATPGELILLNVQSGATSVMASTNYSVGTGQLLHLHENPWSADGRYLLFFAFGAHGVCD